MTKITTEKNKLNLKSREKDVIEKYRRNKGIVKVAWRERASVFDS